MKKLLLLLLCICSLFLFGFEPENTINPEEQLGKTDMEIAENKRLSDFEGEIVKAIDIENDIIKQNKIYRNIAGEDVTGGTEGIGISYWDKYTNWYVYDQLLDRDKKLWDNLDTVYMPYLLTGKEYDKPKALNIEGFSSLDELYNSTFMYLYCHPQLYFLRPHLYGYTSKNGYSIEIRFYDNLTSGISRINATLEIEELLDNWLVKIETYKTDLDKIKAIHDLICKKVFYDTAIAGGNYDWDNDPHCSQSIYSTFCQDYTVCAGYAKAFSCVASGAGLTSVALNGSGHAWNMVMVNNEWYFLDSTWDDCISTYKYFLCGMKEFNDNSHKRNEYWDFLETPMNNYRDYRVVNLNVQYGQNSTPFYYGFIDYILGGSNLDDYIQYQLFKLPTYSNRTHNLSSIDRTGYKFEGWYIDDKKVKKVKKTEDNVIVKAKWIPFTYDIKFVKGGKGVKLNTVQGKMNKAENLKYDSVYSLPANQYVRKGYTFIGWTTQKDGTEIEYTDEDSIRNLTDKNNKTIKLYALWKEEVK